MLYGLAGLIGSCWALAYLSLPFVFAFFILIAIPVFFLTHHKAQYTVRFGLALLLFLTTYTLTKEKHLLPPENQTNIQGIANFSISSIYASKLTFQKAWTYQGVLHSFIPDSQEHSSKNIAFGIPIQLHIPYNTDLNQRPDASHVYQIHGRLKNHGGNRYTLTPQKEATWTPKAKTWNLAEWRLKTKTAFSYYIQQHVHDPHVASFLAGIATGDFNDRLLSFELSRFGLQHLMAISGLHFTIIASILGFCLRLFFSLRLSALLLIVALSGYFVFLGSSPSVIRAWITIVVGLTALLIEKPSAALNSLGLGLLFISLWDPFSIQHIGFQFSFLVTASILLWFSFCDKLLQTCFPKRPLSHAIQMNGLDRHAYCLLFFFRQGLALSIAVNLVALPLTLFYFNKFPLLGLFYNLFFPFLISFSMLLLLIATSATLILPWLGNYIHAINESYTHFVLNFTFKLPKAFDVNFYSPSFALELLIVYMVVIFIVGILVKEKYKETYEEC